jgi:hypothetical protein
MRPHRHARAPLTGLGGGHLQGAPTTTIITFYIGAPGNRPPSPLVSFAETHIIK